MKDGGTLPGDLLARLETLSEPVSRVPGVLFAYLFGSAASGQMRPSSDVDVAVYLDSSADAFETRLDIFAAASKHLGTDRLDVVVLNSAPLALAGRILTTRRVLVDRTAFLRHRYESLTARMFQDFRTREHRILAERYARG
jgi:predicted nucleotidyltransferase